MDAPHVFWHEDALLHDTHVESIRAFCAAGGGMLTWSTPVSEGSWEAALAVRHCDGRIVLAWKGGYARSYSVFCLHATLAGALGS